MYFVGLCVIPYKNITYFTIVALWHIASDGVIYEPPFLYVELYVNESGVMLTTCEILFWGEYLLRCWR